MDFLFWLFLVSCGLDVVLTHSCHEKYTTQLLDQVTTVEYIASLGNLGEKENVRVMWCYHQLVVALKFYRATKSATKLFHQATTWLRDGRENLKKVRVWCLYNVVLPSASLNATNSFVTSNYRQL